MGTNASSGRLLPFVNDHLTLRRGLAVLEGMRKAVRKRKPPQTAALLALVDFFRGFGDGCHHVREDKILMPEMRAAGLFRSGGPVDLVVKWHSNLRDLMTAMESSIPSLQAMSSDASRRFLDASGDYADALLEHLQYEDKTLMPAAEFNLGADRIAHVLEGCAAHDRSQEHTGSHLRYVAALDRLAGQYLEVDPAGQANRSPAFQ